MSSSSIPNVLQVVAPRAEAKPEQPSASQGQEFRRLLARASDSGEPRPATATDAGEPLDAEQPLANSAYKDATSSQDDHATNTETLVLVPIEAEAEPAEEILLDEIVLSEAAAYALAIQATPAVEQPTYAAVDAELVATVVDASAGEPIPSVDGEPQAAATELSQTFMAQPNVEQVVASEAVVVDPAIETSTGAQSTAEQSAPTGVAETSEQTPRKLTSVETFGSALNQEAANVVQQAIKTPTEPKPAVPAKLTRPTQSGAKPTESAQAEATAAPVEEEDATEKTTKPDPLAATAPVKQEATVAGETKVVADKKVRTESGTPELSTVSHGGNENTQQPTRATHEAGAGSAAQADAPTDSDPVSTVDRARFVQRVSRAFQSAHGRDGLIQLRLSPPELGTLKIAITTQQGVLSAKVEADTAAARNIILDNLPALRERLAEQQIRLEKFDVDVRRDGGQDANHWEAADRQPRHSDNSHGTNRLRQSTVAAQRVARPLGGVTDGSLDVRI